MSHWYHLQRWLVAPGRYHILRSTIYIQWIMNRWQGVKYRSCTVGQTMPGIWYPLPRWLVAPGRYHTIFNISKYNIHTMNNESSTGGEVQIRQTMLGIFLLYVWIDVGITMSWIMCCTRCCYFRSFRLVKHEGWEMLWWWWWDGRRIGAGTEFTDWCSCDIIGGTFSHHLTKRNYLKYDKWGNYCIVWQRW